MGRWHGRWWRCAGCTYHVRDCARVRVYGSCKHRMGFGLTGAPLALTMTRATSRWSRYKTLRVRGGRGPCVRRRRVARSEYGWHELPTLYLTAVRRREHRLISHQLVAAHAVGRQEVPLPQRHLLGSVKLTTPPLRLANVALAYAGRTPLGHHIPRHAEAIRRANAHLGHRRCHQ